MVYQTLTNISCLQQAHCQWKRQCLESINVLGFAACNGNHTSTSSTVAYKAGTYSFKLEHGQCVGRAAVSAQSCPTASPAPFLLWLGARLPGHAYLHMSERMCTFKCVRIWMYQGHHVIDSCVSIWTIFSSREATSEGTKRFIVTWEVCGLEGLAESDSHRISCAVGPNIVIVEAASPRVM